MGMVRVKGVVEKWLDRGERVEGKSGEVGGGGWGIEMVGEKMVEKGEGGMEVVRVKVKESGGYGGVVGKGVGVGVGGLVCGWGVEFYGVNEGVWEEKGGGGG